MVPTENSKESLMIVDTGTIDWSVIQIKHVNYSFKSLLIMICRFLTSFSPSVGSASSIVRPDIAKGPPHLTLNVGKNTTLKFLDLAMLRHLQLACRMWPCYKRKNRGDFNLPKTTPTTRLTLTPPNPSRTPTPTQAAAGPSRHTPVSKWSFIWDKPGYLCLYKVWVRCDFTWDPVPHSVQGYHLRKHNDYLFFP